MALATEDIAMYDPDYGLYDGQPGDPRTPELRCPECGSGDVYVQHWFGSSYFVCDDCGHKETDDDVFYQ
jgi:hypothetical protein